MKEREREREKRVKKIGGLRGGRANGRIDRWAGREKRVLRWTNSSQTNRLIFRGTTRKKRRTFEL